MEVEGWVDPDLPVRAADALGRQVADPDSSHSTTVLAPISISESSPNPARATDRAASGPRDRLTDLHQASMARRREIRSVGTGFVAGVGSGLELEGGMLHVEVPGDAGLELVELARGAAVGKAGAIDDDAGEQGTFPRDGVLLPGP